MRQGTVPCLPSIEFYENKNVATSVTIPANSKAHVNLDVTTNDSISENSKKSNTFDKKIDDERKSISKSVDSEGNSLSAVRQGTVGCL